MASAAQFAAVTPTGRARSRVGRGLQVIGGLVLLLLVVPLALIAAFLAWRQYRILSTWPQVEGTVIQAHWIEDRSQPGRAATYGAEFQFRYVVGGREYQAVAAQGYNGSYDQARRWLSELPVGAHRRIRYEPDNPLVISLASDSSTLSFGVVYGLARWALILAGACLIMLIGGWRLGRKPQLPAP